MNCEVSPKADVTPKALAAAAGISVPYASQILSGRRANVSNVIALTAFRELGLRIGVLAEMTAADLDQLCATRSHGQPSMASDGGVSASKQGADCAPAAGEGM